MNVIVKFQTKFTQPINFHMVQKIAKYEQTLHHAINSTLTYMKCKTKRDKTMVRALGQGGYEFES